MTAAALVVAGLLLLVTGGELLVTRYVLVAGIVSAVTSLIADWTDH